MDANSMLILISAQEWEQSLIWELNQISRDTKPHIMGPGIVQCQEIPALDHSDLVFARQWLPQAQELYGDSVKQLADGILDHLQPCISTQTNWFLLHIRTPDWFTQSAKHYQSIQPRLNLVEKSVFQQIRHYWPKLTKRFMMTKPIKADDKQESSPNSENILYIQCIFVARDRLFLSIRKPHKNIANRKIPILNFPWQQITQDIDAPCRSYYKIEEAWIELNEHPEPDQECIDIGAAPGGWSWSALKYGAKVIAVDDADLSPLVAQHPKCEHRRENGFNFAPAKQVDWLFCDIIAKPLASLGVLERWLTNHWCRGFVVAIKFRGQDASTLLEAIYKLKSSYTFSKFLIRHLYFNHNEITLIGKTS